MEKKSLFRLQKKAEGWVKEAGKILQVYQEKAIVKKRKADSLDITTDADLKSEHFLIKQVHKHFPEHSILSEEAGEIRKKSGFTWIIDPLDGTKEYARGLPMYNVCLALEYKTTTIMGVVFIPPSNELFSTSKGNGAFLNNKKISVSSEKKMENSFIGTHVPNFQHSNKESRFTWQVLERLARKVYRLRPFAGDVNSLCWVAQGAHEGFVSTISGPKWWDVAAGLLMVEEAGGKVTNIYGKPIKNRDLSKGIVASNGKIHEELLKYLK